MGKPDSRSGIISAASQLSSQLSNLTGGNRFVFIGDSRCAQMFVSPNIPGKSGTHYWNWANALNSQCMKLAPGVGNGLSSSSSAYGNFGVSGYRSDQFLFANSTAGGGTISGTAPSNLAAALQINSGWMVFDPAAVNDISQAPYTDILGRSVTAANVASMVAGNIQSAALQAVALGKKVIVVSEQSATTFSTTQIQAVFEYNDRMRRFCQATNGCFFFDLTSTLWNPTSSASAIVFKTGYSTDGTHYTNLACYYAGLAFNTFISSLFPVTDIEPANILDNTTTNPLQLIVNPLFNTVTGGTTGGAGTVTGNVPNGWQLVVPANISATVSSAANANGYGNDITIAMTAAAAGTVNMNIPGIAMAAWNLTDTFEGGIECTVASGSSNMAVYYQPQVVTDQGGPQNYDMYSLTNGPTVGYTVKFDTLPVGVLAGSTTKSYVAPFIFANFTAAGSGTITLRRPWFNRYPGF